MTTSQQRDRLRADLGATSAEISDAEADDLFARAEAEYSAPAAIEARARLLALRGLMAQAAKRADYTQNASAEKLGQIFDHLASLRALYDEELRWAVATANPAAQWGGLRRKPVRQEEYPDA
jgi:hypothetical protein